MQAEVQVGKQVQYIKRIYRTQKEPYRIRVIYWIYGIRSPQLYRNRVLYWTYGIRLA